MSQLSSNGRRVLREVAQDARARERAEIRYAIEREWLKVSAYTRIPGILRRGMLSGLNKAMQIVDERSSSGNDQSPGDCPGGSDEGAGC